MPIFAGATLGLPSMPQLGSLIHDIDYYTGMLYMSIPNYIDQLSQYFPNIVLNSFLSIHL